MKQYEIKAFPGMTFHIPENQEEMMNAYVSVANRDQRFSFMAFYVQTIFDDLKENTSNVALLSQLLTEEQNETFRIKTAELIADQWSDEVVALSAEETAKLKENLIALSDAFTTADAWQALLESLVAAGNNAPHLAKGIYLAFKYDYIWDDATDYFRQHVSNSGDPEYCILDYLKQQPADADYLIEMLDFFSEELKLNIDASVLLLLAKNKRFDKLKKMLTADYVRSLTQIDSRSTNNTL